MNAVLTLMPERCTDKVDVYHVRLDNIKGKIYGILTKPRSQENILPFYMYRARAYGLIMGKLTRRQKDSSPLPLVFTVFL